MLETVAPVLDQAGVHDLVLFSVDRVGKLSCIAHGYLFIPSFVARLMFPTERIEAGDTDIKVGQGHGDR